MSVAEINFFKISTDHLLPVPKMNASVIHLISNLIFHRLIVLLFSQYSRRACPGQEKHFLIGINFCER